MLKAQAQKFIAKSLSSRRAWIEMYDKTPYKNLAYCRSPHGERGLKSLEWWEMQRRNGVALLTESVDWNNFNNIINHT